MANKFSFTPSTVSLCDDGNYEIADESAKITGTTPPAVPCPDSLCKERTDVNYEYYYRQFNPHYFIQCSNGLAYCQACWPLNFEFSEPCNQCMNNRKDECVTTKKSNPVPTFVCPEDMCPQRGLHFSGNIADPSNPHQYIACFHGNTVGCIACPKRLKFNEKRNACLYEGKFKTIKHEWIG